MRARHRLSRAFASPDPTSEVLLLCLLPLYYLDLFLTNLNSKVEPNAVDR